MPLAPTRRRFLYLALGMSGGGLLAACSQSTPAAPTAAPATAASKPTSAPAPTAATPAVQGFEPDVRQHLHFHSVWLKQG